MIESTCSPAAAMRSGANMNGRTTAQKLSFSNQGLSVILSSSTRFTASHHSRRPNSNAGTKPCRGEGRPGTGDRDRPEGAGSRGDCKCQIADIKVQKEGNHRGHKEHRGK